MTLPGKFRPDRGQSNLYNDRREPESSFMKLSNLMQNAGDGPEDLLEQVRQVKWVHPVLVVYRPAGENRWSYVTITGTDEPEED